MSRFCWNFYVRRTLGVNLSRQCLMIGVAFLLAWIGLTLGETKSLHAASTPPSLPCRGCHSDNQRQFTFPSGEVAPLLVELAQVDASAHSSFAANPVACTGCHVNSTHYRYPHKSATVPARQDLIKAVERQCQNCHYPHMPFHEVGPSAVITSSTHLSATQILTEATAISPSTPIAIALVADNLPTCVDCHGSHTIDRIENILDKMPSNCLTCHKDKNVAWVKTFIAPRSGVGQGAKDYIGSMRCVGCHQTEYFAWQATLHARMVQDPVQNPKGIVGNFDQPDPDRTFTLQDVRYTIGSTWRQVYLSQTVEGKYFVLPAQWNVATQEWAPYQTHEGKGADWLKECGSCHVTGLNTQQWGFTELSVGCESCHGPGKAHAAAPKQVKLFNKADDQVCGSCHSRGKSPEGFAFPATYRPGDTLTEHFKLATEQSALWPNGSAKQNHQQYTDWHNENRMVKSGKVRCTTCHAVHQADAASHQLLLPLNELCLQCHKEQKALVRHTPFHEHAISKEQKNFLCVDCHMPALASSATAFDLRIHTFLQPDPQASIDHGGLAAMPNACNRCHHAPGEDVQWAAQTVAYAKKLATPSAASFFGPGPTPTSPPPPTPISVVGQRVEVTEVSAGRWLRTSLITGFWAMLALIVLWVLISLRLRRVKNA